MSFTEKVALAGGQTLIFWIPLAIVLYFFIILRWRKVIKKTKRTFILMACASLGWLFLGVLSRVLEKSLGFIPAFIETLTFIFSPIIFFLIVYTIAYFVFPPKNASKQEAK